jgi:DNA-binding GntR family transcriptional regulator
MAEDKHLRLASAIRRRIESGELPPGTKLPSTRELRAYYNVGNETVRWAMRTLVDEGLVVTGHGVGRWVAPGPTDPLAK